MNPSAVSCQKMDISMVLNSSREENHQTVSPNMNAWNEKAQLLPQQYYPLPPMRTQPPSARHSYDGTQTYGRSFSCFDCFGRSSRSQYRSQGHGNHCQPAFAWYQTLPSVEVQADLKLPPLLTLDAWNGTGGTRIKIDDVRLNPKKSPRRASASPIIGRHSLRSPSLGIAMRPRQLTRPYPTQGQDEDNVIYVVDVDDEATSRGSCNRPYNIAQVDWVRYTKVDLSLSYDSMAKPFALVWPGESKTGHCFSARFYRDNWIPRVDVNNNPVYDEKGAIIMDSAKMRDIKSEEGKEKGVPYSLVERYPWRALEYPWVDEEHKEIARAIMRGQDPIDPTGSKYSPVVFLL